MNKRLDRKFFERSTLVVAKELIGKYLVRKIGNTVVVARITETEAYHGPDDLASHASKGKTNRTAIMFGPAGYSYVYLIYGMYHCFNIVTGKENFPSAVLIRGLDSEKCDGPGKLCRSFQIDKSLNGIDLITSTELWVEDRGERPLKIQRGPRVGVDYAGAWKDKPWRWYTVTNAEKCKRPTQRAPRKAR